MARVYNKLPFGTILPALTFCSECGNIVFDQAAHDAWHIVVNNVKTLYPVNPPPE